MVLSYEPQIRNAHQIMAMIVYILKGDANFALTVSILTKMLASFYGLSYTDTDS